MRTAILIVLGGLLCAPTCFGQQPAPLYVPYQPPAAPQQYAQPAQLHHPDHLVGLEVHHFPPVDESIGDEDRCFCFRRR